MGKTFERLTNAQLKEKDKLEKKLSTVEKPVLKSGSPEHRIAKERLMFLLVHEQERVANALIRKAKGGDVRAIVEFFDRLYGKSKETIDLSGNVTFSLKALAEARREVEAKVIEIADNESSAELKEDY